MLRRVHVTGSAGDALVLECGRTATAPRPGEPAGARARREAVVAAQPRVVGEMVAGPTWTFRPERIIGDSGRATRCAMSRIGRPAQGYLDRRSLPRPQIPWADLTTLKAGGTAPRQAPAAGPPSSR